MAKSYDLKLDESDDLYIDPVTGDIDFVESDEIHIRDIIDSFPGDWKNYPQLGVGLLQYKNSSNSEDIITRNIKIQLESDNYQIQKLLVTKTKEIIVNADRI